MASDSSGDLSTSGSDDFASPEMVSAAASALEYVRQTLVMVAQSIQDQANALAGPDGPWRGDAARAFHGQMALYSKQVMANAEVLAVSGGESSLPRGDGRSSDSESGNSESGEN
jgi:uncharacterized protein YukE